MNQVKTTLPMDDSKSFPEVQITFMDITDDAVVVNNYGSHGSPPLGTKAIMLEVSGNKYIIPLMSENREKLEEGEYIIGNFKVGSTIKFDKNNNTVLKSKEIHINGEDKRFVTYAELDSALQTFIATLNLAFMTKVDGIGAPASLSLDISSSETQTVKTGG